MRSLVITALVVVLIAYWLRWLDVHLYRASYASGYLLFGLVAFLALFNLRKKLPSLPLGSASTWLQSHLYVGIIAGAVFGMHLAWRVPNGWFEGLLAVTFMMTFVSGIVGLVVSRRVPHLLNRVRHQVIYERSPAIRRLLAERSRQTVLESVAASGGTTLADFYTAKLFDFFARPRPLGYFVLPSSARRKQLLADMQHLDRYLSPSEKTACERLFAMVRRKDDLDFQEVQQRRVKLWLFGHIALTYALIVFATVHGVLALAFRGDGL
jgi:uncharacterized membrane protein